MTTVAPSRANNSAMARPMPRLAPLTMATLSLRVRVGVVMGRLWTVEAIDYGRRLVDRGVPQDQGFGDQRLGEVRGIGNRWAPDEIELKLHGAVAIGDEIG